MQPERFSMTRWRARKPIGIMYASETMWIREKHGLHAGLMHGFGGLFRVVTRDPMHDRHEWVCYGNIGMSSHGRRFEINTQEIDSIKRLALPVDTPIVSIEKLGQHSFMADYPVGEY